VTGIWTRAAEDDPLDGLRTALAHADCGLEPRGGFEDHCWLLHAVHDGPVRLRWDDVLARAGRRFADWPLTPSYLVFEGVEGADDLDGPGDAEPDATTLARLVAHLAHHSADGLATWCGAAQAPVSTDGTLVAWRGRLGDAPAHREARPADVFPATWWAADGSWHVLADWDLNATEVFGSRALIADLLADPELEAVRRPTIAETFRTFPG
jgi:hypothetical protein